MNLSCPRLLTYSVDHTESQPHKIPLPPDTPQPQDSRTIIIPWKNIISARGYRILTAGALGIAIFYPLLSDSDPYWQVPLFVSAIFALLAVVAFFKGFSAIVRERKWIAYLTDDDASAQTPEELAIILTQWWKAQHWIMRRWKLGYYPSYEKITNAFHKHNWTTPNYIIDQKYEKKINAIPRTPNLLEPEMIKRYGTIKEFLGRIGLGLLSVFVIFGIKPFGDWVDIIGYLIIFALFQQFVIIIIYIFTGRSSSNYGTAGLGIIELNNGQTLRTEDCITLIYKKGTMRVRLLASNGEIIDFDFADPDDPGFIIFWERWNHPNPRPELL